MIKTPFVRFKLDERGFLLLKFRTQYLTLQFFTYIYREDDCALYFFNSFL